MNIPIRVRLVVATSLMMMVVLAGTGLFIAFRLQSELTSTVDSGLRSRAQQVLGAPTDERAVDAGTSLVEPDESFVQVLTTAGEVVASSAGLGGAPLVSAEQIAGVQGATLLSSDVPTSEEVIPARLLVVPDADRVLVVGTSLEDQREAVGRLAVLLLVGGLGAVVLSGLAGWVVAGLALRPVDRMRAAAEGISSSRGQRLVVPATRDEVEHLGRTLNDMLDRLDGAYEQQRRFAADASHELRTPLANLVLEAELALRGPQEPEALRRALEGIETELDHLMQLARDLLDVARAEDGTLRLELADEDLNALVRSQVESFAARAAAAGVTINQDLAGSVTVRCDARRIRQVVANLVDNAIRHAGEDGVVDVATRSDPDQVTLSVHDTGKGFPDEPHLAFEPFWRADPGRHRDDGGTGLGLTIVRAIVDAHGGEIRAENDPVGGASVRVRLPR